MIDDSDILQCFITSIFHIKNRVVVLHFSMFPIIAETAKVHSSAPVQCSVCKFSKPCPASSISTPSPSFRPFPWIRSPFPITYKGLICGEFDLSFSSILTLTKEQRSL